MGHERLTAISPVDGRYAARCETVSEIFSELGLIRYRARVELRWLKHLCASDGVLNLDSTAASAVHDLSEDITLEDAIAIKDLEAGTNHDVKALEYFLKDRVDRLPGGEQFREFVHFACTSEDINNVAYALMLKDARDEVLLPVMDELQAELALLVDRYAELPMLARTHGQPATPTTLGKELANFLHRLGRQKRRLEAVEVIAKMNGAVGNFNAHLVAYPSLDWPLIGRRFVESIGLAWNPYTTQIEPHDWIAEYCDALAAYNVVALDLSRDLWGYIALGYFRQRPVEGEVGSSTMPHKVNPIDFENAEGNVGVANALLRHFSDKLPVSRWQRDLSDSTVLRNLGVALAHSLIALTSCRKGLNKLDADPKRIADDLDECWEVLAEPIQTVMRRYGIANPYEQLKTLTRGKRISKEDIREFVDGLDIPEDARTRLLELTPVDYVGLAAELARKVRTEE